MLPTYQAVLRGDRIEWVGDTPDIPDGIELRVHVTLLDLPTPEPVRDQKQRMAEALARLEAIRASGPVRLPTSRKPTDGR